MMVTLLAEGTGQHICGGPAWRYREVLKISLLVDSQKISQDFEVIENVKQIEEKQI